MKKILLLLMAVSLLAACKKMGDLPDLPTYTPFKMTSSSAARTHEIMVGDSVVALDMSASKTISRYLPTGLQPFRIRETGASTWLLDSTVDLQRPGMVVAMVDKGAGVKPLVLTPADIKTAPPTAGYRKYSLINIDATAFLKNRTIDISIYDANFEEGTFIPLGELKGLKYLEISDFVELKDPLSGNFFLTITDSNTGEVIATMDSYLSSMLYPQDGNNAFIMKLMNVGDDNFMYFSADPLLSTKK